MTAGPPDSVQRPAAAFGSLSLSARLVLLVLAGMLPLLGFSMALEYLDYQSARRNAEQQALSLARGLALAVERELQSRVAALQVLALSRPLQAGDLAAFQRRAETTAGEMFAGSNLVLLDAEGRSLIDLAPLKTSAPADRPDPATVREVLALARPMVSDVQRGGSGTPGVWIEVPVRGADGRIDRVLALQPAPDEFAAVIRDQQLPRGWVVSVFDRQGVIVARMPNGGPSVGLKAAADFLPHLLAGREGVTAAHSLEGVPLLGAFSHAGNFGWAVGIGMPQSEVTGPALASALRILWAYAGALVLGLLLALVVARQISRPIAAVRRLAGAAIGDARLAPPSTGLRETDEVALALQVAETERRRIEADRSDLVARQRLILAQMPIGCMVTDAGRRFSYWNPAAERIFGWSFAEIEGRDPFDTITPAEQQATVAALRSRLEAGEASVDVVGENVTRDGRRIVCEWRMCELRQPDGRFHGVLSMCVDVTQRRQVEEQLRQAQKMEAVGQLTGGVAHDFNNLLMIVMGSVDAVEERLKDRPELRGELERVLRAVERGATLTRSLLAFARRQPLAPQRVDLNRLVQDMEPLLVRTLGETIEIEVVQAAGLWLCEVDAAQLQNALANLTINARDAMPTGGKLTIETGNTRLDAEYAARHADVVPGQYVALTVADTGDGMAPEIAARAFEPFFSTKNGKGSGLGLSMVYGFVKQSGGHVHIYSEPGLGTSIRIYFPRSYGPVAAREADVETTAAGGSETVLVVEDDADVRALAVSQLQSLGYAALATATATEALTLLEGREVALLLTDVVLAGGIDGRQLAEQALRLKPGLKVLYMSGYSENAIVHHGRLDPTVELLQKPFRKQDLAAKLRALLEPSQG